jgi:hypothetical protein
MLFAGTLRYSEPKRFYLNIFYNGPCIILKHEFYATCKHVHMYAYNPSSQHNGTSIKNVHIPHILSISSLNDNFDFSLNYYYYIYIYL